jgi:integrase
VIRCLGGRPGHRCQQYLDVLGFDRRCSCQKVVAAAGLTPREWTPRELRHSFVSLLSDVGVPIERISRLVGHSGTSTTETIYRKQIRPVITHGADVLDQIFPGGAAPNA